jgi:hypothetical protein
MKLRVSKRKDIKLFQYFQARKGKGEGGTSMTANNQLKKIDTLRVIGNPRPGVLETNEEYKKKISN